MAPGANLYAQTFYRIATQLRRCALCRAVERTSSAQVQRGIVRFRPSLSNPRPPRAKAVWGKPAPVCSVRSSLKGALRSWSTVRTIAGVIRLNLQCRNGNEAKRSELQTGSRCPAVTMLSSSRRHDGARSFSVFGEASNPRRSGAQLALCCGSAYV